MTPEAFVELCKALRPLGATSVEAEGFRASFGSQEPAREPQSRRIERVLTDSEREKQAREAVERDRNKMLERI